MLRIVSSQCKTAKRNYFFPFLTFTCETSHGLFVYLRCSPVSLTPAKPQKLCVTGSVISHVFLLVFLLLL